MSSVEFDSAANRCSAPRHTSASQSMCTVKEAGAIGGHGGRDGGGDEGGGKGGGKQAPKT